MRTHRLDPTGELDSRIQLVLDPDAVAVTPAKRRYVERFIASQGFVARSLSDEAVMAIFKPLARLEEYTTLLKHGQHNWEACFAPLHQQQDRLSPVIDILLRNWCRDGLIDKSPSHYPLWPNNKRFALILTHDIDSFATGRFLRSCRALLRVGTAPRRQQVITVLGLLKHILAMATGGRRAQEGSLDGFLSEEKKYGFHSSFFFLCDHPPEETWEDAFYRYSDLVLFNSKKLPISEVMRSIAENGWDIGLHGASASSKSADILSREKQVLDSLLGHSVTTIRQHHLLYDVRYTPLYQSRAGFEADSSLGSNIDIGFRCGTSFPFWLYDVVSDTELDTLEVPLIIQDGVLFSSMQLDRALALRHCMELLERVADVGGALTILWHNNTPRASPQFAVYADILAAAARMGAWGCSVDEINRWWRTRVSVCVPNRACPHESRELNEAI